MSSRLSRLLLESAMCLTSLQLIQLRSLSNESIRPQPPFVACIPSLLASPSWTPSSAMSRRCKQLRLLRSTCNEILTTAKRLCIMQCSKRTTCVDAMPRILFKPPSSVLRSPLLDVRFRWNSNKFHERNKLFGSGSRERSPREIAWCQDSLRRLFLSTIMLQLSIAQLPEVRGYLDFMSRPGPG